MFNQEEFTVDGSQFTVGGFKIYQEKRPAPLTGNRKHIEQFGQNVLQSRSYV
jgi:hypothetical protein